MLRIFSIVMVLAATQSSAYAGICCKGSDCQEKAEMNACINTAGSTFYPKYDTLKKFEKHCFTETGDWKLSCGLSSQKPQGFIAAKKEKKLKEKAEKEKAEKEKLASKDGKAEDTSKKDDKNAKKEDPKSKGNLKVSAPEEPKVAVVEPTKEQKESASREFDSGLKQTEGQQNIAAANRARAEYSSTLNEYNKAKASSEASADKIEKLTSQNDELFEKAAKEEGFSRKDIKNLTADQRKDILDNHSELNAKLNANNAAIKAETDKKSEFDTRAEVAGAKLDDQKANAKSADDLAAGDVSAAQIQEKNADKEYGGKYGGASIQVSQTINQGVSMLSGVTDAIGTSAVQRSKDDQQIALQEKGMTATNQDIVNAHTDVAHSAASQLNTVGVVNTLMGAYQLFRSYEHINSIQKVKGTAGTAQSELQKIHDDKVAAENTQHEIDLKACDARGTGAATCKASLVQGHNQRLAAYGAELDARNAIVNENHAGEGSEQSNAAVQQAMTAGQSVLKGVQAFGEAKNIKAYFGEAPVAGDVHFAMTQGAPIQNPNDPTLAPIPETGAIVDNDPANGDGLGNIPAINPNDNSGVPMGPAAAAWKANDKEQMGQGGNVGMGGAGSTSAASDKDGAGNASPGAQPKAGSYAAMEAQKGSYRGSNGGGAKVGVDHSFTDLLKKFLPGGDAEKGKLNQNGALNYADRSPASDQAAVIGRNKNIFDEIHKRYQKKNTEGAIVF